MSTMRHAFFSTHEAQVCHRCGARYGRCEHTAAPDPVVPMTNGPEPRQLTKFKNAWSPSEDALLAELWLGGETQGYIAKCLKRPKTSVASRISRLGLRGAR